MAASVAIGIVCDDTVHFFSRYYGSRGAGASPREAVRASVRRVGRPAVYTTLFILALGFSLFSVSGYNFKPADGPKRNGPVQGRFSSRTAESTLPKLPRAHGPQTRKS